MADPRDAVVAQWLQKARRDLASARRLLQGEATEPLAASAMANRAMG